MRYTYILKLNKELLVLSVFATKLKLSLCIIFSSWINIRYIGCRITFCFIFLPLELTVSRFHLPRKWWKTMISKRYNFCTTTWFLSSAYTYIYFSLHFLVYLLRSELTANLIKYKVVKHWNEGVYQMKYWYPPTNIQVSYTLFSSIIHIQAQLQFSIIYFNFN